MWFLGEFAAARPHFEKGIELYNPQHSPAYILHYGQDEGMTCLSYEALVLWFLGYPDQALQRSQAALALAQKQAHPFSLAYALIYAAWFHQFRREVVPTRERAEAATALSIEQSFPFWLAWGHMLQGWALVEQGPATPTRGRLGQAGEEGVARLRQGLAAFRATGAEISWHYLLSLLAEAYHKVGQAEAGLAVAAEALAAVPGTGLWWEAELYRLKGRLLRQAGVEAEAEACFWQAIEVARRQAARSLELRATMSLSRLWQSQGETKAARQVLAEIYGWFHEGFATPDLTAAQALLNQWA